MSARAAHAMLVNRVLRQHGYPPDKQEAATATATALVQAELLCADWAG